MHSHSYPLSIIQAPAGYGKTTFLKQWYEDQLQDRGAACWLSLDEEEKNPGRFLCYLAAAMKVAGVPCEALEKITGQVTDGISAGAVTAVVISTLEQFDRQLLLFFDDYHLASCKAVNELIRKTVCRLPENVGFILSSRVFPALAVQSLTNQDKVRVISTADLRFNLEETNSVMENTLLDPDLEQVWNRTEGWPIACRMINSLLRKKLFDVNHLDTFSGRSAELANYITEEVFVSLGEHEQKFLMRTAVTNRFTGDLANVLCDNIDCWSILDTLSTQGLLLVPLDLENKWYRCHQLFREYLYERLRRTARKEIPRLHLMAAEWLFDNHYVPEAVEHAITGQDLTRAAWMVDKSGGWRLIYQDRLGWMTGILERIGRPVLEQFPRLFLAELIVLIKQGKPRSALERANEVYGKTNGYREMAGVPVERNIRVEFDLLKRMILEDYNDRPVSEGMLSSALDYLRSVPDDDHILRAIIHDTLSSAYIEAGLLDKAGEHANNAAFMYQEAGFYYGVIFIYCHRANIYMQRARLHEANKEVLRAREIISEYLVANADTMANTSVYLAEVAYLQNRLENARELLDPILGFVEKHDGWFQLYAKAYTTAAGIALSTLGIEEARAMLARGRATATERQLTRLKMLCDLLEIKFLLQVGEVTRAQQLAHRIELASLAEQCPGAENLSVFIPQRAVIVLARLKLMQHRPAEVLQLLHPLADTLHAQRCFRLLVESWLLMARAVLLEKNYTVAEDLFSKAVRVAMHEDYKRPFIDEGEAVVKLYHCNKRQKPVKTRSGMYSTFCAGINRTVRQQLDTTNRRLKKYGLTCKEYKVIMELVEGKTNREIAETLHVSEDTVKYRLKKLFKKWNVCSREAVIRDARDKLLLSP